MSSSAVVARYSKLPLRVAAFLRNSLETVEVALPILRAIAVMLRPCARQIAISSRSSERRYRPDSGGAELEYCDGGMPPASRNQRLPTGQTHQLELRPLRWKYLSQSMARTKLAAPDALLLVDRPNSPSRDRFDPKLFCLSSSQSPFYEHCDNRLNPPFSGWVERFMMLFVQRGLEIPRSRPKSFSDGCSENRRPTVLL
jgi:hypothetical protein